METAHVDLQNLRKLLLEQGLTDDQIESIVVMTSVPVNFSAELRIQEGLEKAAAEGRPALLRYLLQNNWSSNLYLLRAVEEAAFTEEEFVVGLIRWCTEDRWRSYGAHIYTNNPVFKKFFETYDSRRLLDAMVSIIGEPEMTVLTTLIEEAAAGSELHDLLHKSLYSLRKTLGMW